MSYPESLPKSEVDLLLRNAELRDELERFADESLTWINSEQLPTERENEFLEAMLAWERAPLMPIAHWFTPELRLPPPDCLEEDELRELLWDAIHKLYERRIVLDFTDHLSDRQLYTLILRDILPAYEKRIESEDHWLHWDCAGDDQDWLRYYATMQDREAWAEERGEDLPPREDPPFIRALPYHPL